MNLELVTFVIGTVILFTTVIECTGDSCNLNWLMPIFVGVIPTIAFTGMYGQALLYYLYVKRLTGAYLIDQNITLNSQQNI